MTPPLREAVVVAGASGFIGRALLDRLQKEGFPSRVIALTRGPASGRFSPPGIQWRKCDLFSLMQCERGLRGAGQAVYLAHSMLPSARLTQGEFQDMDLILADNFARAAAHAGLHRILYVGGLLPEGPEISRHLRSRLEVERVLGSRGTPVTSLRAGIVIGPGGSSWTILERLVRRAALIACPPWADKQCRPIALEDLLSLILHVLHRPPHESESFDVGGPEMLSYRRMLERTALVMGLRRIFFSLPLEGTAAWSALLAKITGAPKELTGPLLESMRSDLRVRDLRLQEQAGIPGLSFDAAVRAALAADSGRAHEAPRSWKRKRYAENIARSVQRVPLPSGRDASWVAERYGALHSWMLRWPVQAEMDEHRNVRMYWRLPRLLLLELRFAHERSPKPDRQVYYITGGLLARPVNRASGRPRLEFREIPGSGCVLAALHDYRPALPWFLYNIVQAPLHLWVMRRFQLRILD
ncbi:MAG: NAD-dependent epimerase/dehydratase family protein [Elusimicrobiota bacterium]|jgi:uncharacterized protein YbjT (DUF2867 family)